MLSLIIMTYIIELYYFMAKLIYYIEKKIVKVFEKKYKFS